MTAASSSKTLRTYLYDIPARFDKGYEITDWPMAKSIGLADMPSYYGVQNGIDVLARKIRQEREAIGTASELIPWLTPGSEGGCGGPQTAAPGIAFKNVLIQAFASGATGFNVFANLGVYDGSIWLGMRDAIAAVAPYEDLLCDGAPAPVNTTFSDVAPAAVVSAMQAKSGDGGGVKMLIASSTVPHLLATRFTVRVQGADASWRLCDVRTLRSVTFAADGTGTARWDNDAEDGTVLVLGTETPCHRRLPVKSDDPDRTSACNTSSGRSLPWGWPGWSTLATSTWGSNSSCCHPSAPEKRQARCCSGIDSPEEARFKNQFDLVYIDNGLGSPGCNFPFMNLGGNDTTLGCHKHRSEGAAAIKAVDKAKPVFVYRQISAKLEGADLAAIADLMVTHDDRGNPVPPGRLDWRKPAAASWYVDHIIGLHTSADPNADGVFIDGPIESSQLVCATNFSLASKKAMLAGVAGMLRDATKLLSSHNKVLTASLGSHYSSLDASAWTKSPDSEGGGTCPPGMADSAMASCCAGGEDVFYETIGAYECGGNMFVPFRQFNIPSRDFGDAVSRPDPSITAPVQSQWRCCSWWCPSGCISLTLPPSGTRWERYIRLRRCRRGRGA
eukprot:SAG22_NODE_285_length_12974_cov_2.969087_3_plen_615_part_00